MALASLYIFYALHIAVLVQKNMWTYIVADASCDVHARCRDQKDKKGSEKESVIMVKSLVCFFVLGRWD